MKQLLCSTLLLLTIICFTTCKKDNGGPSTTLPEATQEGKNTFGMKVNGEIWTPYYKCGPSANPCGAFDMKYNQPGAPDYYFNYHLGRSLNGTLYGIVINTNRSGVKDIGNKYDSINVEYYVGLTDYIKSSKSKGEFIITKLDTSNKVIAGTFSFTLFNLYNSNDSIIITDGRFDSKFYTCICN